MEKGASIGAASRYAVLTTNVSKVIATSGGRELQPTEQRLMDRAADLLDKIVQGSRFIENKEAHALSAPHENFLAFDHAMSALRRIKFESGENEGLTHTFAILQEDLRKLARNEVIDAGERVSMCRFFDALGELFYRDIADSSMAEHGTEFDRVVV